MRPARRAWIPRLPDDAGLNALPVDLNDHLVADGYEIVGPEWSALLMLDASAMRMTYAGFISMNMRPICRLALHVEASDPDRAGALLVARARRWISAYVARPHTGDTAYAEL